MVVVCSKRKTVWERAHGEDRGRWFKISLCRRGSASIAAESGRQESSDRVQTATSRTTPWTFEKSNENHTKSIKNVRNTKVGDHFWCPQGPDEMATPGQGPILVSSGCWTRRPPHLGDHFWCSLGAGRSVHPRRGTNFGVLRVPLRTSSF